MSTATQERTSQAPVGESQPQLPATSRQTGTSVRVTSEAPAYLTDSAAFEHLWRVAVGFAKSSLVPEVFRGKVEDRFIACQLAVRLNVDPFMLLQNIYIVHGKPGFEAKLSIALLNASGKIRGTLGYRFDGEGDEYGCTAFVVDAFTGETVTGPKVDQRMVKGEGWHKPKGQQVSKWMTMPEQMYRYRSATFLIRAHYPEVLMGLQTREEIEETQEPAPLAAPPRSLDALADRLEAEGSTSGQTDGAQTDVTGLAELTLGGKQYQVTKNKNLWCYRLIGTAQWIHATEETAELIEAALSPQTDESPAESYDSSRKAFLAALTSANSYKACDEAVAEFAGDLPAAASDWMKEQAEARKLGIKAARDKKTTPAEQSKPGGIDVAADLRKQAEKAKGDPIAAGKVRRAIKSAAESGDITPEVADELIGQLE